MKQPVGQRNSETPTADAASQAPPARSDGGNLPSRWLLGGALLGGAALVWAYWPTLADMVAQWERHADYSHGYLVAPIAAAFLWLRRDSFPADDIQPSILGLLFLTGVVGLRIAAGAFYLRPLDGWTFPLAVAGIVWLLFGGKVLRWAAPAIAFLWFMVPLPYTAETWLSVPLQNLATRASTVVLVMLGQPAISEGHTIWLGEHQLFVEEACSGLRILIGIFALAFAFVLFSRWSWWQKGMALVAAIPIALTANVMRIVATGLLHEWVSGDAAQKFSHDVSGFVMIPLAALMFWGFLAYLDRLFPEVEDVSPLMPMMRAR
jgi:exosortase